MKGVILFLVIILFQQSILSLPEAKLDNGLSIDLIHRDSPLSPFYDSLMTQREVLLNSAMRSVSRNNHFNFTADDHGSKAETVVALIQGDYLMKIFIGTPPAESFAIADTGSGLVWVQCLPCQDCYKQTDPIFDPKHSSTYEEIPCLSDSCSLIDKHSCGATDQCRYLITYADESLSEGDLAKETINFGSNAGAFASPKTIFGCGHVNTGLYKSASTGIVGLGGGPLSLVSQLGDEIGHIFSYCLLPYTANSTSKLKIGSESTMPGAVTVTTPFVFKGRSAYYLTLNAVSIEDVKVQQESEESIDIIIDSGTTLTFLAKALYKSVEAAVAKVIDAPRLRFTRKPFNLCYILANIEFEEYPDITFHFAGANVHLRKENIFVTMGKIICLSIVPTDGLSVFGNLAQINMKVEYDLQRKTVSFAPVDCTKE